MTKTTFDPIWGKIRDLAHINNDADYGDFVSKWPLEYYRKRLIQLDFQYYDHVLDVGCGFGQWLIALATLNKTVTGIDVHQKRIETCNALAEDLWMDNVVAKIASAVDLPFEDESFDALFCYGMFMFVDRDKALSEYQRVLKPGGALYVCTNARGWWLKLAIERFRSNRNLSKLSWTAFLSGRQKGVPNSTDIKDVRPLLGRHGFTEIRAAGEGLLTMDGQRSAVEPHYAAKYLGFDCVIEFTARKLIGQLPASCVLRSKKFALFDRVIEHAVEANTYSFIDALNRYKAIDTIEKTFATRESVIALARTVTRDIDRPVALQRIFQMATSGVTNVADKAKRCLTLTQKLFFHHFALQPIVDGQMSLSDPLEAIIFGACRCGTSARFLVDLLTSSGIKARMISGSCHTAAEALIDGRWILLDASLYPPGIFPMGSDGGMLTVAEAVEQPTLLDRAPSYVNQHAGFVRVFAHDYPLMAKAIERYLRAPLFPSVGYFAAELGDLKQAGKIRRWRKAGNTSDGHYGWASVSEDTPIQGPCLPTMQRPEEVLNVTLRERTLSWDPAVTFDGGSVVYDVYLASEPRGWSYERIPVGCDFALRGRPLGTADCHLKLDDDIGDRRYVTIVAKRADRPDAFYLPSDEFVLGGRST